MEEPSPVDRECTRAGLPAPTPAPAPAAASTASTTSSTAAVCNANRTRVAAIAAAITTPNSADRHVCSVAITTTPAAATTTVAGALANQRTLTGYPRRRERTRPALSVRFTARSPAAPSTDHQASYRGSRAAPAATPPRGEFARCGRSAPPRSSPARTTARRSYGRCGAAAPPGWPTAAPASPVVRRGSASFRGQQHSRRAVTPAQARSSRQERIGPARQGAADQSVSYVPQCSLDGDTLVALNRRKYLFC